MMHCKYKYSACTCSCLFLTKVSEQKAELIVWSKFSLENSEVEMREVKGRVILVRNIKLTSTNLNEWRFISAE